MRLLGVLHLAGVDARRVRHVLRAVELAGLDPGGVDRRLGQRDRVGPHIGDVAVLVQPLRHRHRVLGREAELAGRLLLQRRGAERRVRRAPVRLALNRLDAERNAVQPSCQFAGAQPVDHAGGGIWPVPCWPGQARRVALAGQVQQVGVAQLPGRGEVAALRHPAAVHRHQPGGEGRDVVVRGAGAVGDLGEDRFQVPVGGRAERDPLPLAGDDQPGGDRLDPAGRQPRHDLLPQHRRDLVAVQPVEHPPGLVGVDEAVVEVAGVGHRLRDRLRGDLVEDHPARRDLGLELLQQVPGDRLALTVLIGGEQQFVGVGQQVLELAHLLASCRQAPHKGPRSRGPRPRRAGPRAPCGTWPVSRPPCRACRGCGRCSTRPRIPCPGTRRWCAPWPVTRR